MNDVQMQELEQRMRADIPERPFVGVVTTARKEERAERRAAALNAVTLARNHAGRQEEPYSQAEADTIMAIMELLDRVAETQ